MRYLSRLCASILILALPNVSSALEWNQAQLTWTLVNSYDDFSPILVPVAYRIYAANKGATKTVVTTVSTNSALRSNIPAGTWCWQIAAVVGIVEGAKSEEVCKGISKTVSTTPAQVSGLKVE